MSDTDSADLLTDAAAADRGEVPAPGAAQGQGSRMVGVELTENAEQNAERIEAGLWIAAFMEWSDFVRATIGTLSPACAARFDDARALKIGAAIARVCKYHGWKFADVAAIGNPWVGLARDCFPVAEPAVMPLVMRAFKKPDAPAAAAPASSPPANVEGTPGS